MGLRYEADVVVLRPSGWATEVEIKISASDIRADLRKKHQHNSDLFRELWFAVPEALRDHPDIPERAGILYAVEEHRGLCVHRKPIRRDAKKWTPEQRLKLLRLASLRTWSLKMKMDDARRKGTD